MRSNCGTSGIGTDAHAIEPAAGDEVVAHEHLGIARAAELVGEPLCIVGRGECARLHEQRAHRGGGHGSRQDDGSAAAAVLTGWLVSGAEGSGSAASVTGPGGIRGRARERQCADRGHGQVSVKGGIEGLQRAHLHHRGAVAQHVELRGGRVGKIDDAVAHEGSPIVHPHDATAPVLQVGDPHIGGQRQCLVCRRHAVHVVGLAHGGELFVKTRPIPGGHAALHVADARVHDVIALAEDLVGSRIAVDRARLCPRYRIGHVEQVGGRRRRLGAPRRDLRRGGRRAGTRRRAGAAAQARREGECERGETMGLHGWLPGGADPAARGEAGAAAGGVGPGAMARCASLASTCCLTAAASSYTAMA